MSDNPLKARLETRCGCTRIMDIGEECGVKSATHRINVHLSPSNFGDNRNEERTFELMGTKDGLLWYKETTTQRIPTMDEVIRDAERQIRKQKKALKP